MKDWREQAACRGMNPELWFPVTETPKTKQQLREIRIAKEACARCEVRMDCLIYAITRGERHGIWGGMSERERRGRAGQRIRRQVLATV